MAHVLRAFGREVAASDDGSRVSELTDASRPSGRSGTRSMLGSLAVGSGAGGMGRAKVDPGYEDVLRDGGRSS